MRLKDGSIRKVGGHLLYDTKYQNHRTMHVLSCCLTETLGKIKNRKKEVGSLQKDKRRIKNKMTSLIQSLCTVLGLGMTWGMYNARRGLFTHMTVTLSADIPDIDARPYHLIFGLSTCLVDFVVSTKH